jgi:hypothetical protein
VVLGLAAHLVVLERNLRSLDRAIIEKACGMVCNEEKGA